MTNREMTLHMREHGYANDLQCHLRGMTRAPGRVSNAQLWLALNRKQNALMLPVEQRPQPKPKKGSGAKAWASPAQVLPASRAVGAMTRQPATLGDGNSTPVWPATALDL